MSSGLQGLGVMSWDVPVTVLTRTSSCTAISSTVIAIMADEVLATGAATPILTASAADGRVAPLLLPSSARGCERVGVATPVANASGVFHVIIQ